MTLVLRKPERIKRQRNFLNHKLKSFLFLFFSMIYSTSPKCVFFFEYIFLFWLNRIFFCVERCCIFHSRLFSFYRCPLGPQNLCAVCSSSFYFFRTGIYSVLIVVVFFTLASFSFYYLSLPLGHNEK